MSKCRLVIVSCLLALILCPCFAGVGKADDFPSNKELGERNVALKMYRFDFASGMKQDAQGKPNGNGAELVEVGSSGSGFLVREDGTILTNYHVARKAVKGEAIFDEGSRFEIRNIRVYDRKNDLAVLQISSQKAFPNCMLGDSDKVEPRDKVMAVGNPLGMGLNITEGAISQVVRNDMRQTERINHTATITSGNSGGALYRGNQVIGVNAAVMVNPAFGGSTGFFYAIPINKAKVLLEDPQYNRILPLQQIFPPSIEAIAKKAKQIDAATGQVAGAQGQGASMKPGAWKTGFQGHHLTDYGFLVETPGQNVALVVLDGQGKTKGFASRRSQQYLPLFMDSSYPDQYTIIVLNFDQKPVNFGLKIYDIIW
ncbi:MAG: S1C family serine protease [Syntrophobacteraceae bacterium]